MSQASSSSSSSHAGMVGRLVTLAAASTVGLGLLYFKYQRGARDVGGGRGIGGGEAGARPPAVAPPPSAAPLRDEQLARLEKIRHKLEVRSDSFDLDAASALSAYESAPSSPTASSAAASLSGSSKNLARVLRALRHRRFRKRDVSALHALEYGKIVLLLFRQRSLGTGGEGDLSASRGLIPKSAEQVRREEEELEADLDHAWRMMDEHSGEVEDMQRRIDAQKYQSAYPSPPTPPFSDRFPPPLFRNEYHCVMLELAYEREDATRMWKALVALLRIQLTDEMATAASSSSSSAPAASSSSSATPLLLSASHLASLDYRSLLGAFYSAALLGCWLLVFQIGQRLFSAPPLSASSSSSASTVQQPLREEDDLYHNFHESALDSGSIDYAIVWDIAVQKAQQRIAADPSLKEKLGISGDMPQSRLPFDEQGRVLIAGATSSPTHQAAASSSPLPSDLPAFSQLQWCEYAIAAYSTEVQSVETADETLRQSLFDILAEQKEVVRFFHTASPPASPVSDSLASPPPPSLQPSLSPTALAALRSRIRRRGCLFQSLGLFAQSIPIVGTTTALPASPASSSNSPRATSSSPSFSMRGYCHVPAPAATLESDGQDFVQYEYYSFTPAPPSVLAKSMTDAQTAAAIAFPFAPGGAVLSSPPLTPPLTPPLHAAAAAAHDAELDSSPASPTSPSRSAHLFDSASFAELSMEHFHAPNAQAPTTAAAAPASDVSALLSPVVRPSLASPAASSPSFPSPSPLQRVAFELGSKAEVWSGTYRVIQEPLADESGEPPSRPRVLVTYRLQLVLQRIDDDDEAKGH